MIRYGEYSQKRIQGLGLVNPGLEDRLLGIARFQESHESIEGTLGRLASGLELQETLFKRVGYRGVPRKPEDRLDALLWGSGRFVLDQGLRGSGFEGSRKMKAHACRCHNNLWSASRT